MNGNSTWHYYCVEKICKCFDEMVTFWKLLAYSKGDLNPLIDQLLEFFPQMTKSTATRLSFKAFNREDEISAEKSIIIFEQNYYLPTPKFGWDYNERISTFWEIGVILISYIRSRKLILKRFFRYCEENM